MVSYWFLGLVPLMNLWDYINSTEYCHGHCAVPAAEKSKSIFSKICHLNLTDETCVNNLLTVVPNLQRLKLLSHCRGKWPKHSFIQ